MKLARRFGGLWEGKEELLASIPVNITGKMFGGRLAPESLGSLQVPSKIYV